ncbi:MAG: hypothetical protein PUC44_01010 [Eubacteriales bacterium]|nr:hypothetical protein [Eubacteriales bacterium]
MNRLFVKEKTEEKKPCFRIGVTGTGHRTGVSMVASSLALWSAEQGYSVSYTECWDPGRLGSSVYEGAGFEKRFPNGNFQDVFHAVRGNRILPPGCNQTKGVLWKIHTPEGLEEGKSPADSERAWIIASDRREVQILDLDTLHGSGWREYLDWCDWIFAVLDPLPSRLLIEKEQIQFLKRIEIERKEAERQRGPKQDRHARGRAPSGFFLGKKHPGFTWIVNFMNAGVGRKMVQRLLRSTDILWIPAFPAQIFYENEYYCKFYFENNMIHKEIVKILENTGI